MQVQISQQQLTDALSQRHGAACQQKLQRACVGIAGLGGLGSHIAMLLTRAGVGHLVLADHDRVELSNLNRQQYRLSDVGRLKTAALTEQLRQINPYLHYEPKTIRLDAQNIPAVFSGCDIICEALDVPESKALLTETVLQRLPQARLIVCSGMAGCASANAITTSQRLQRLYLCGDGTSDVSDCGSLFAPRVAVCASHAATMALRLLLGFTTP